ncbi:hypothetical protein DFS34DRAFT_296352 [Phlyctochytrium arcticum]|nr:hypothetical protein DFS34DRAFT_296352 [Phlyctochytrium arcticum]
MLESERSRIATTPELGPWSLAWGREQPNDDTQSRTVGHAKWTANDSAAACGGSRKPPATHQCKRRACSVARLHHPCQTIHWRHQLSTRPFSFVDMFPWLSLEPEDAAMAQLSAYLQATRPLLRVTFSKKVSSFAAANFYHPLGLSVHAGFLTFVGVPRLQHYAPREWLNDTTTTQPPSGFATIVVPHYHPGLDKCGSRQDPHTLDIRVTS